MAGDKYLYNNAGTITEKAAIQSSAGAGDAGKVPALDAAGLLSTTMMPVGVGPSTITVTASEALASGDFVNIWDSTGAKVRKADATAAGKEAHGFVLAAVDQAASATVYLSGINTSVTGLTVGAQYFLAATAGGVNATAPSTSGNVVQRVGVAPSTTSISFKPSQPIVLA